jgi:hypothetical protein
VSVLLTPEGGPLRKAGVVFFARWAFTVCGLYRTICHRDLRASLADPVSNLTDIRRRRWHGGILPDGYFTLPKWSLVNPMTMVMIIVHAFISGICSKEPKMPYGIGELSGHEIRNYN